MAILDLIGVFVIAALLYLGATKVIEMRQKYLKAINNQKDDNK